MGNARALILLAGSAVFVTSIAIGSTSRDQAAEQQYKNIQSFRGDPASKLITTMQFMSASLGVDCEFCHTQKWESDDKQAKQTARKMIAMTREINARDFGGGMTVTCATCHGGHPTPTGEPKVHGMTTMVKPDFSPNPGISAQGVLSRYESAIGGASATSNLKSLRLTGTYTVNNETPVSEDVYEQMPNRFSVLLHDPRGERRTGFNGTDTWIWNSKNGSRKLDGSIATRIQNGNRFFRDAGSMTPIGDMAAADAQVEGQRYVAVKGNEGGDTTEILYFDPNSGLLRRAAYFTDTLLGTLPEVYEYDDYRTVAGVQIPMRITMHNSEATTVRQYSNAIPNPKIDAPIFDLPK